MTTPNRRSRTPQVPLVSPTPDSISSAGRAEYPRGYYFPGMFKDVDSVDAFANILGVPAAAIPLIIPTDTPCKSKDCPHNAIMGNGNHCPAHRRSWYPLLKDLGSDLVAPEFLRWHMKKKFRGCDCSNSSCYSTGYFPNQEPFYISTTGFPTLLKTPNLLSSEKKKEIREGKIKQVRLYPWQFFGDHRECGEDGIWKLKYNKTDKAAKYYDLEGYAYDFPPPRNTPGSFLHDEYFSSYIHPRDRWTNTITKMPPWMLNTLAIVSVLDPSPPEIEELSLPQAMREIEQYKARAHFLQQQKMKLEKRHAQQLAGQKRKHEDMMGKANAEIGEKKRKIEDFEKQNQELQEKLRRLRGQLEALKQSKGKPLRYHDLCEGCVLSKHVEQFTLFHTFEQNDEFLELINYADGSEGSFLVGDGLCENLRPYSKVKREERSGEVDPPSLDTDEYEKYLKKRRAAMRNGMRWKDDYLAYCIYVRAGTTQAFAATLVGICVTRMSDIFHEWSQVLEEALVEMFPRPTRSQMLRAYPSRFIEADGHSRCSMLLDASEIFVQQSSNTNVASSTHSDYKGHTTVKFLGACDPIGCVPAKFISEDNPGRAGDGLITKHSNILHEVPFGHTVKVDKGFLIENDAAALGVHVDRPQKRLQKQVQQSTVDTSQTQKVGNTRIIVENVNGELKLGIHYLNVLIPCTQFGIISKVVRIGYLLQNFKKAIIQKRNPDETAPQRSRPCRAEIRWYGATDDGLVDVRGNVRLWGMKSEIELHNKLSQMEEHKTKTPTEISEMVLAKNLHVTKRKELHEKRKKLYEKAS
ncbi:hypothetical protein ACHAXR_006013 [Thalassiosira sp. AJA248-18]